MSDEKISVTLSKSDTAFFIRAVYDSLIVPDWNRGDVIDLGSNILKKVPLSSFGDKLLGRLLPSLTKAAESLYERMTTWLAEQNRQLIAEHEQLMAERDKLAADFASLSKDHHSLEADHQKIVGELKAYVASHPDRPVVEEIVAPPGDNTDKPIIP